MGVSVQIAVSYRSAFAADLYRKYITFLHLVQAPMSVVADILDLRLNIFLNEEDSVVEQGRPYLGDSRTLHWVVVDLYTIEKLSNHVLIHDDVLVIYPSNFGAAGVERCEVASA